MNCELRVEPFFWLDACSSLICCDETGLIPTRRGKTQLITFKKRLVYSTLMSLMLVDDDNCFRTMLERFLKKFEIPYVAFDRCATALSYYARNHGVIGCVLTDVEMPDGINGVELTSELLKVNNRLPVYVMSGCDSYASSALSSGAKKFFSKTDFKNIFQSLRDDFVR